jgi:hypothetical protein
MIPTKPLKFALAAALAAGAIALPAAAQPSTVSPIDVAGAAPTTVRVSIHGKSEAAVYKDVRVAANFVCGNAVGIHGLDLNDLGWCADRASLKAMKHYATIMRGRDVAASEVIQLSAR